MKKSSTLAINGGVPIRNRPLPWELPGIYSLGEEEKNLVIQVLDSKSLFRFYGPNLQHTVDQLEIGWALRLKRKYSLAVNSGSSALEIALASMRVGPGVEVLVPGYLWVSCISAIVRLGAIPRLVDIDDTFCMDPVDLKKKINNHSKVVILVHMSGAPGRVIEIKNICRDYGLKLLEDCSQAAGSSSNNIPAGAFGDAAIFSFQLNKNMTSGEGGMIVCDDDELYKRCYAIHDVGYLRNSMGRIEMTNTNYSLWGTGSRMSELTGAVALVQLSKLDNTINMMRNIKWFIRKEIENIPGIMFRNILDPKGDSGSFLIIIFKTSDICDEFVAALQAEGIRGSEGSSAFISMKEWGLHWYFNNLSLVERASNSSDGFPWTHPANEFSREYTYCFGNLPVCDDLAERSAILTIAPCLNEYDTADIINAFYKVSNELLR